MRRCKREGNPFHWQRAVGHPPQRARRKHLNNRIPGNTAAGQAVAVKLKDLFGMSEDQAESVKDVVLGYVLGVASTLIGLVLESMS